MSTAKALSNSLLKGILTDALVGRGSCVNLDSTDMLPGVYTTHTESVVTFPSALGGNAKFGLLIVFPKRFGCIWQFLLAIDSNLAIRVYNSGGWQDWKSLFPT